MTTSGGRRRPQIPLRTLYRVDDEITIRIKRSTTADRATRPADTARVGQDERAAFESARELYFRLRHKFPTDPPGN